MLRSRQERIRSTIAMAARRVAEGASPLRYGQAAKRGDFHEINCHGEHRGAGECTYCDEYGQRTHRNTRHRQGGGNQDIDVRGRQDPIAGSGRPKMPTLSVIVGGGLIAEDDGHEPERSEGAQIHIQGIFSVRQDGPAGAR